MWPLLSDNPVCHGDRNSEPAGRRRPTSSAATKASPRTSLASTLGTEREASQQEHGETPSQALPEKHPGYLIGCSALGLGLKSGRPKTVPTAGGNNSARHGMFSWKWVFLQSVTWNSAANSRKRSATAETVSGSVEVPAVSPTVLRSRTTPAGDRPHSRCGIPSFLPRWRRRRAGGCCCCSARRPRRWCRSPGSAPGAHSGGFWSAGRRCRQSEPQRGASRLEWLPPRPGPSRSAGSSGRLRPGGLLPGDLRIGRLLQSPRPPGNHRTAL